MTRTFSQLHILLWVTVLTILVSSRCSAQYTWEVTHGYQDDTTVAYAPLLLGCSGNHCTAIVNAGRKTGNWFTFLRSDDGGLSWRDQWQLRDPGIPYLGFVFFAAIQQIDSLNAVAVGDSGHIFRTFDGGVTWEKQTCPPPFPIGPLRGVHFHDPMNGIIGAPENPITTSDGGRHWTSGPTLPLGAQNCHCYGAGKFAVLCETTLKLYRTLDNWTTIDSSRGITDTSIHASALRWGDWGDGDTIIACGYNANGGLVFRTSDGGKTWNKATIEDAFHAGPIICMTALSDDTLLAGCSYHGNILFSSDQGRTWRFDTVPTPSDVTEGVNGIARPAPGIVVASAPFLGGVGDIVRGSISYAGVPVYRTIAIANSYPNPVDETVTITFTTRPEPVQVFDVLGREIMRVPAPTTDWLTLNTASLPSGIYFALHGQERARFVKE